MLCTFCGTDNRPEHKFCGMCGVRLERRKEQRRVRPYSSTVTCQSCGTINDSQTKFCGMCGLRIERRATERRSSSVDADDLRANAFANAQLPTPDAPGPRSEPPTSVDLMSPPPEEEIEARRAAETIFHSRPSPSTTIGGPSFLGLGNDSESEPSGYLLEDDVPSGSHRGLVFLVILVLMGGLAFMGYRAGYFSNLEAAATHKLSPGPVPQASPLTSPSNPVSASAPPTDPPADTASAAAAASPGEAKDDVDSGDAPDRSSTPTASEGTLPNSKQPGTPPASDPAPASASATTSSKAPKDIPPSAKRKPSLALAQAQNYLQGRGGVHQDCDQGLIYLKAATEKNDPAAAVQMGALYASGHCVQQDRVMAYRWFNSAHELDPANPWIQTNLDQLWAQMTSQERRQVAR